MRTVSAAAQQAARRKAAGLPAPGGPAATAPVPTTAPGPAPAATGGQAVAYFTIPAPVAALEAPTAGRVDSYPLRRGDCGIAVVSARGVVQCHNPGRWPVTLGGVKVYTCTTHHKATALRRYTGPARTTALWDSLAEAAK